MTDLRGVFTFVNRQFEQLYGYAAAEVVGRTTPRLLKSGTTSEGEYARLWQDLREHETVWRQFVNCTRNGRLVYVDASLSQIRDEGGALVGFLAIQRDVSARKRDEEQLRIHQALIATERELTPDGILGVDCEGRVLSYNRRFAQMWGVSEDALDSRSETTLLDEVLHKLQDPDEFVRRIRELYDSRDEVSHEEVKLKDNRTFERYSAPMHSPLGEYYGRIWYFRDVTERRLSEEAVQQAEERMRFALESAGVGTWDMDYATGLVRWSPTMEAQYGIAPGTFGGSYEAFLAFVHPDDRATLQATVDATTESHNKFQVMLRILRPDGTLRWLRSAGRIHFGPDGQPSRAVGVSLDMTNERQLEVELGHAQKLESVGRLAAGVAHEINTPMQFVGDSVRFVQEALEELFALLYKYRALTETVLAGQPAERAAREARDAEFESDLPYLLENLPDALDRSMRGLSRVSRIVQSMKEFAHPDRTEMAPTDLNRAIQSTLTIARTEYKYVADLDTDYGELPLVTCHGGDVNQVVLNLIVNAAHAIADKVEGTARKGRISVQTRADGDTVVVRIADTGGGIPEAIRGNVFDPFFTTKALGKGTGQGLAIARAVVVEKHGGQLTFETETGVGTTFVMRLPVSSPHAHDVPNAGRPDAA